MNCKITFHRPQPKKSVDVIESPYTLEGEKYILAMKKALLKHIDDPSLKLDDIKLSNINSGLFEVYFEGNRRRFYNVQDLSRWIYGDTWYYDNEYKDVNIKGFGKHRISLTYYMLGPLQNPIAGKCSYTLCAGCEPIYYWKNRQNIKGTERTDKQLRYIVKRWLDDYIRDGCPGGADPRVVKTVLAHYFAGYASRTIKFINETLEVPTTLKAI